MARSTVTAGGSCIMRVKYRSRSPDKKRWEQSERDRRGRRSWLATEPFKARPVSNELISPFSSEAK